MRPGGDRPEKTLPNVPTWDGLGYQASAQRAGRGEARGAFGGRFGRARGPGARSGQDPGEDAPLIGWPGKAASDWSTPRGRPLRRRESGTRKGRPQSGPPASAGSPRCGVLTSAALRPLACGSWLRSAGPPRPSNPRAMKAATPSAEPLAQPGWSPRNGQLGKRRLRLLQRPPPASF